MKGLIFFLLFPALTNTALAQVTAPTFPLCANPQGIVKVQYNAGTHGIVNDSTTRTGSDTVYTLTNETLTQCFCAIDGNGIQTNWWKVSSLTTDEVNLLVTQGWHSVPNGALWGLEETPYLAINSSYGCKPAGEVENTTFNSSSTSSSDPNSTSGQVLATTTNSGQVLGITSQGQVLGLATTGNIQTIFVLMILSLISLPVGYVLILSTYSTEDIRRTTSKNFFRQIPDNFRANLF